MERVVFKSRCEIRFSGWCPHGTVYQVTWKSISGRLERPQEHRTRKDSNAIMMENPLVISQVAVFATSPFPHPNPRLPPPILRPNTPPQPILRCDTPKRTSGQTVRSLGPVAKPNPHLRGLQPRPMARNNLAPSLTWLRHHLPPNGVHAARD